MVSGTKIKNKFNNPYLVERIVEPCSHRRSPRLDRDELAVGLVHRLAGLVEVPQVQEHLADQLVLFNERKLV